MYNLDNQQYSCFCGKNNYIADYRQITTDRQFRDSTGYSRADFSKLLSDYELTYQDLHGQSYETYISENVTEAPKLKTLGGALFFVLFQMKNDLIFGSLGVVFGMCGASASNNFKSFSKLLEQTLRKKILPKRVFENVEDFEQQVAGAKELIFDGTENLIEHPQGYDRQRDSCSEKIKNIQV